MNAVEPVVPRAVEEEDLANARQALQSIRDLRDPMSGRIDNWSQR